MKKNTMTKLNTIATKGFERIKAADGKLKGMAIANATALEMQDVIMLIKDAKEHKEAFAYKENFKAEAKKIWKNK